ncbi:MAG: hypothetical protein HN759_01705 [Akkermansiaceae bacterium]|nr:hypothetical protein [Akkermansiaceae bacterium]
MINPLSETCQSAPLRPRYKLRRLWVGLSIAIDQGQGVYTCHDGYPKRRVTPGL